MTTFITLVDASNINSDASSSTGNGVARSKDTTPAAARRSLRVPTDSSRDVIRTRTSLALATVGISMSHTMRCGQVDASAASSSASASASASASTPVSSSEESSEESIPLRRRRRAAAAASARPVCFPMNVKTCFGVVGVWSTSAATASGVSSALAGAAVRDRDVAAVADARAFLRARTRASLASAAAINVVILSCSSAVRLLLQYRRLVRLRDAPVVALAPRHVVVEFHEGDVVPRVRGAAKIEVHDDAVERVRRRRVALERRVRGHVRRQVKMHRKLDPFCDFTETPDLEPFQRHDENVRGYVNLAPFRSPDVRVAATALVLVVSVQRLHVHEVRLKARLDRRRPARADLHRDVDHALVVSRVVPAIAAHDFPARVSAEDVIRHRRLLRALIERLLRVLARVLFQPPHVHGVEQTANRLPDVRLVLARHAERPAARGAAALRVVRLRREVRGEQPSVVEALQRARGEARVAAVAQSRGRAIEPLAVDLIAPSREDVGDAVVRVDVLRRREEADALDVLHLRLRRESRVVVVVVVVVVPHRSRAIAASDEKRSERERPPERARDAPAQVREIRRVRAREDEHDRHEERVNVRDDDARAGSPCVAREQRAGSKCARVR
eukprot:31021-Pelagococcus_subviridis.AAC.6